MFNNIKKRVIVGKIYACHALFNWYAKQIHTMVKDLDNLYVKSELLVDKMRKLTSELDEMETKEGLAA